jgi:hypothetical protein
VSRREVAATLTLDASEPITKAEELAAALKVSKAEMKDLGDASDKTGDDLVTYAAEAKLAEHATGDLGDKTAKATVEVKGLDERIKAAKVNVGQFAVQYAQSGDVIDRKNLTSARSALALLEKTRRDILAYAESKPAEEAAILASAGVAKTFEQGATQGLKNAFEGDSLSSILIPAAIGAAPLLGSVISGAIVGTVAGAGIAGGIFSAAKQPAVQAAFKQFKTDIAGSFFGGDSLAFVKPIEQGLKILEDDFAKAHIGDALAKAAPSVTTLAKGIGGFVDNLMPGFNAVLDKSGPITHVFATGLEKTGTALSKFLIEVESSPGTIQGLSDAFSVLDKTVIGLGYGLHYLGDVYSVSRKANSAIAATEFLFAKSLSGGALRPQDIQDSFKVAEDANAAVGVATSATDAFAAAQQHATVTLTGTTQAAQLETASMNDLYNSLTKSATASSDLWGQQLTLDQTLVNINTAIKDGTTGWNLNTQAGVNNQGMIRDLQQEYQVLLQTALDKAGADKNARIEAEKNYNSQIDKLEQLAVQLGATKTQAKALDDLKVVIEVTYSVKAVAGVTSGVGSGLRAETLNFMHYGRAAGGPVTAGQTYRVNEQRPEALVMPLGGGGPMQFTPGADGFVTPMGAVGGGGSGGWAGGGGDVNVTVSTAPGADSQLLSGILQYLRFTVDNQYSGDAQLALSRR